MRVISILCKLYFSVIYYTKLVAKVHFYGFYTFCWNSQYFKSYRKKCALKTMNCLTLGKNGSVYCCSENKLWEYVLKSEVSAIQLKCIFSSNYLSGSIAYVGILFGELFWGFVIMCLLSTLRNKEVLGPFTQKAWEIGTIKFMASSFHSWQDVRMGHTVLWYSIPSLL